MWDLGFGIRDSGFGIRESEFNRKFPNPQSQIPKSYSQMRNPARSKGARSRERSVGGARSSCSQPEILPAKCTKSAKRGSDRFPAFRADSRATILSANVSRTSI